MLWISTLVNRKAWFRLHLFGMKVPFIFFLPKEYLTILLTIHVVRGNKHDDRLTIKLSLEIINAEVYESLLSLYPQTARPIFMKSVWR